MENEHEYSFESTFESICYLSPFHCVLNLYMFLIPVALASLACLSTSYLCYLYLSKNFKGKCQRLLTTVFYGLEN